MKKLRVKDLIIFNDFSMGNKNKRNACSIKKMGATNFICTRQNIKRKNR